MEIVFIPDGNETAYSKYVPELQTIISFKNAGEKQNIPDDVAKQLLTDFPRMFGLTEEDIRKARGEIIEIKEIEKEVEEKVEKISKKPVKKLSKRSR